MIENPQATTYPMSLIVKAGFLCRCRFFAVASLFDKILQVVIHL